MQMSEMHRTSRASLGRGSARKRTEGNQSTEIYGKTQSHIFENSDDYLKPQCHRWRT